jgi:hypothetical protein
MKKTFLYTASALLLFAASCKEHGVPISMEDAAPAEDTTYVGPVEAPQSKRILIEELSGVTCVNCPQGAEKLHELDAANPGLLSIVTIHTGVFTDPITGKSKQSFQTDDGITLRQLVWGEQGGKPTAAFDRLPIGNMTNKYFVDGYSDWGSKINQAKTMHPTSPIKLAVTSKYNESKGQYDIEVTIKYTEAVTAQNALHIFLTENKIIDVQELSASNYDMEYEFNHVFRKAITPAATGKIFLADKETKVAGTVYIYRTALKIDTSDPKQKFWTHPENMKVTAFVSNIANDDKRVIQVQETKLVP